MKAFFRLTVGIIVLGAAVRVLAQPTPAPVLVTPPLTAEHLELYRTFLAAYQQGSNGTLNVANVTEPFAPSDSDRTSCLKNFPITHTSVVHPFGAATFSDLNVRLVDPRLHQKRDPGDAIRRGESVDDAVSAGFRAGILTFSEIIFNSRHDRAAITYSFVCGGLCGHGGTVIFRKTGGKWTRDKDRCTRWVS